MTNVPCLEEAASFLPQGFLQSHVLCVGWLLQRSLLNPLVAGKLLGICEYTQAPQMPSTQAQINK